MAHAHNYDLIVIGAGIAGMVSAVTANGLGKRVAVIEKRYVGGNCTNYTCIPSKTLIRLSHTSKELTRLSRIGIWSQSETGLAARNVMSHIRSVVERAYEKDIPDTFEKIGIHMLSGEASFVDRYHVEVNRRTISAKNFIIAVGTRPLIPPIAGLTDVDYLTNETLYQLDNLPKSLIILGGGVDGLEYASAFGRLGVETTVVEMATRLLPGADRELVNQLVSTIESDGIFVLSGTKAVSLRQRQDKVVLAFKQQKGHSGEIEADEVLVALGRRPDLDGLALDKAGVNTAPRGVITDETLKTSAPNIYACGDIVGPDQLASMAEYQGIVAATNAVLPVKQKVDYRNSVYVIFTEPPLAYIGVTEAQAHARLGHKLHVYRFDYSNMRRALIDGTEIGLAKFLCDSRGLLIGAHILGEGAAEVIHEAQVVKALKTPLHRLHLVTHAYPTYAQALVGRSSQLAFLDKMDSNFFVRTALKLFPGLHNRLGVARDRLAEIHPDHSQGKTSRLNVVIESEVQPSSEVQPTCLVLDGKACVIKLPPKLTDPDERPLLAACAWSGSADPRFLILNFSNVTRMNGLGASMLVKMAARARRQGKVLSAFGITESLQDILKVTELDQPMQIHESSMTAFSAAGVEPPEALFETSEHPSNAVNSANWARPVSELSVPPMPKEARNLNVHGRRPVGPISGFGQLWQKIFRLHVSNLSTTPEEIITMLKDNFADFQPPINRFFPSPGGIQPGEIVLIESFTPGGPVSTGVMVLYADERSFTFITPQGHPECGFVSFSAREAEKGPVVEIFGLARASDPVYECAFRLVGSRIQTRIWTHVLASLALYLGVQADITLEQACVDVNLQWSEARNVSQNAQIRTLLNEPKRWFRRN